MYYYYYYYYYYLHYLNSHNSLILAAGVSDCVLGVDGTSSHTRESQLAYYAGVATVA